MCLNSWHAWDVCVDLHSLWCVCVCVCVRVCVCVCVVSSWPVLGPWWHLTCIMCANSCMVCVCVDSHWRARGWAVCGEPSIQGGGPLSLRPYLPGLWHQLLLWWGRSVLSCWLCHFIRVQSNPPSCSSERVKFNPSFCSVEGQYLTHLSEFNHSYILCKGRIQTMLFSCKRARLIQPAIPVKRPNLTGWLFLWKGHT